MTIASIRDQGIIELPEYCSDISCSSVVVCTPQADSCGCCILDLDDAEDRPPSGEVPWTPGGEEPGGGGPGDGDDNNPPPSTSEDCETPADDDGDGEINCEDSDCFTSRVELASSSLTRHFSQAFAFEAQGVPSLCDGVVVFSVEWDLGDGRTVRGNNPVVRYPQPGAYTVTAIVDCPTCDPTTELYAFNVVAWDAQITKPNSRGSGEADGRRNNEIVLSGIGNKDVGLEAQVIPSSAAAAVGNRLLWQLVRPAQQTVNITHQFTPQVTFANRGIGASPTLRFSTLPARHTDFGQYEVLLSLVEDGHTLAQQRAPIELYFEPKTVPTGRTVPNWFFYYTQIFKDTLPFAERISLSIQYQAVSSYPDTAGLVPAMVEFQYSHTFFPRTIVLFDLAYSDNDLTSTYCGKLERPRSRLDLTFSTLVHEYTHVQQVFTCNQYLFTNIPSAWWVHPGFAKGWSFNQEDHSNHYTLGPDLGPGRAGITDNRNAVIDAGGPTASGNLLDLVGGGVTGELGRGDDVNLAPHGDDWCYTAALGGGLGPPPAPIPGSSLGPLEVAACNAALGPGAPNTPTNLDWARGSDAYGSP
ncbi:MAG: PKD domain-containing protein [Deltaproteobacteria bacterium]|nr:PKD domain-containing protein [Deltaproteobacteria bacterium]